MGKVVLGLVLVLVAVVGCTMVWQHWRYLQVRRGVLQDRQPIVHSSDAFHAITFVRTKPGEDLIAAMRALKESTEGPEATWVYAGKSLLQRSSSQIGDEEWSAVAVVQYPSREAFDRHAASEDRKAALARFDDAYTQGFQRSPFISAIIPQGLLAMRAGQILSGQPSNFPFEAAELTEENRDMTQLATRLLSEKEFGSDAILVVNLIKNGSAEQQAANQSYGATMIGAMAEGGYGPMHMGSAVPVERDYDFDNIVLVYYPGVQFFADMARSRFFQGIIGDKQLGDTQATLTAPILDRLDHKS